MELLKIVYNLIDKIMEGFDASKAYKPAYDCQYIYAYVVQRVEEPQEPLITRQPMALSINDDTVGFVNQTLEKLLEDPLTALGLATYLRSMQIPKNVSSHGKAVYWPDEYFYYATRIEVAKALADCIENRARALLNIQRKKDFIGVIKIAHMWQVYDVATVGEWYISLRRDPGQKNWRFIVKKGCNKVAEREFPPDVARILPWGKPIIHEHVRIPAYPFVISVQGYMYNPRYINHSHYPVVVFEINIDMKNNVLIHAPGILGSQLSHLSYSHNRIGDHYIEAYKQEIPKLAHEIDEKKFTINTSLEVSPPPLKIMHIYGDYYLIYNDEEMEITFHHRKKEHPSVVFNKELHKTIIKVSRISYIQAGHD